MSLTFVNKFIFDYICVPESTYKLWHTVQLSSSYLVLHLLNNICMIQRNTRHHLETLRSSVFLCACLLLLSNRNRFGNLIRRRKKALITRRQQWMAAQAQPAIAALPALRSAHLPPQPKTPSATPRKEGPSSMLRIIKMQNLS